MLKYTQIFYFSVIPLLWLLFIYDNITSINIILSVGDINNDIGTNVKTNVNLQGHVHVNDKEAGKNIATQMGIIGAMIGIAGGVAKAIAKSAMPPLQKAGVIVGASVLGGVGQAFISGVNKSVTSTGASGISTATSTSDSINKFLGDSQISPLQTLLSQLEVMDYVCLSMIYIY